MTKILKNREDIIAFKASLAGKKVAFVPTMGNLHDGHLSLMRIAQQQADSVIVSIFVNPTQFGENEDLDSYPRTFESDLQKMREQGVDAVFFPTPEVIYPYGSKSTLSILLPPEMTDILCGVDRPTHFQGVATVVAKLFQLVKPEVAVFGEKDFQQLAIIRRLACELFIDVEILGGRIIREANGLAMSSRNQYLSADEFERAGELSTTLQWCRQALLDGGDIDTVLAKGKEKLHNVGAKVEYLDFRDKDTLTPYPTLTRGVLLVAARIGSTRLIDNLRMES